MIRWAVQAPESFLMADGVWAGIDIGGTKTAVVLAAEAPAMLSRTEFATLPGQGPGRALEMAARILREALEAQGNPVLRGIGVSCGGPLDASAGIIQSPPNLSSWVDVPVKEFFQREFRVPCALENDANAGAVAEHRFGAGRGTRDMVFLTMGTGLGAGVIVNGRLVRGACGMAGEIGHVRLTQKGPVGYRKAGSVEGWASGGGLGHVATAATRSARGPTLLSECLQSGGEVSARNVAEAAARGDRLARRLIRDTGLRLGASLAILVDILNPERIVIGGLAMRLGDALLDPARRVLNQEALPQSAAACSIVPAQLGEGIGDVAAIAVAMGLAP
jgi:glucokinase